MVVSALARAAHARRRCRLPAGRDWQRDHRCPAIAVAEFYFLSIKLGQPVTPSDLMNALDTVGGIELSDLGRAQLERLDRFPEIPEMHDRLIAAEAAALDAPVVTRGCDPFGFASGRDRLVGGARL